MSQDDTLMHMFCFVEGHSLFWSVCLYRVLRYICGCLQKKVRQTWPNDLLVRTRVVRWVAFVSWHLCIESEICPAVVFVLPLKLGRGLNQGECGKVELRSLCPCVLFSSSGFIFLRLLCLAVLNPKQFNLITGMWMRAKFTSEVSGSKLMQWLCLHSLHLSCVVFFFQRHHARWLPGPWSWWPTASSN